MHISSQNTHYFLRFEQFKVFATHFSCPISNASPNIALPFVLLDIFFLLCVSCFAFSNYTPDRIDLIYQLSPSLKQSAREENWLLFLMEISITCKMPSIPNRATNGGCSQNQRLSRGEPTQFKAIRHPLGILLRACFVLHFKLGRNARKFGVTSPPGARIRSKRTVCLSFGSLPVDWKGDWQTKVPHQLSINWYLTIG